MFVLKLTLLILLAFNFSANQYHPSRKIYAVVLVNRKLVVGAKNPTSGLFISKDAGKTWEHIGWPNIKANSIAIEPDSKGKIIYLAAGNGVLKSNDSGKTWKVITDWRITEVLKVLINPENKNKVFIATPYGVFKSIDSGLTWEEKNIGIRPEETGTTSSTFVSSILIDRKNKKRILIGTENGIYESLNEGEQWKVLGLIGVGIRTIVQSPHNLNFILAGTENDGIFKSNDGGKTWEKANVGLKKLTIYAIAFDPRNSKIIYAGGYETGICRSDDEGKSWVCSAEGLDGFNSIHSIAVHPEDSNFIVAGTVDGGVYISRDGGKTWNFSGLEGATVWTVTIE